ncbi:hypothetical protein NMY3_03033 [Candidatus Nitrosocosmicus oleophilus]|uniref:PsbP C-terminal domain-containing protein n=1 Tax=Candidatus Nitrosocosmicus oleophilus TaxID=1353260 RepID=A0A654M2I5_9ARCH|nr:hypothetical protein [Candidatus Nitrosocosmicus oleophilus]ALI37220.1 hypothetical protein NMY3_03033 [Candidatus Nitrosocosmicus oleophilus]
MATAFIIIGPSLHSFVDAQVEIPEARTINEDNTSESQTNDTNTSYLSHTDNDLGFSLEYPDSWEIGVGGNAYQIVSFSSPDDTASAYVMFVPREDDQSLRSFGDAFVKENEDFKFNTYYRNSTTLLADQPAFRASGTYFNTVTPIERSLGYESSNTKTLQTVTLDEKNDGFIGIIYHADDQVTYDKYLPLLEHMISSLTLSSSGPVISEDE